MYELPQSLLVANPINRYLINSPMLPSLVPDPDGGYTLTSRTPRRARQGSQLAARAEGTVRAGAAAVLAQARRAQWHLEGAEARKGLALTAAVLDDIEADPGPKASGCNRTWVAGGG